jgi:hypothetical protein
MMEGLKGIQKSFDEKIPLGFLEVKVSKGRILNRLITSG